MTRFQLYRHPDAEPAVLAATDQYEAAVNAFYSIPINQGTALADAAEEVKRRQRDLGAALLAQDKRRRLDIQKRTV